MKEKGENLKKRIKNSGSLLTLLSDKALESILNKLEWSEPDHTLHQRTLLDDIPILMRGSLKDLRFEINGVYYHGAANWIEKRDPKVKPKEPPEWITLK